MTRREAMKTAEKEIGGASAALDARLLVQKACHASHERLLLTLGDGLTEEEEKEFRALLDRRKSHEPMAYILGHREFWDLDFLVDSRVLIPQPDTETLVAAVLDRIRPDSRLRLLDLCTGSGCVGITLACHLSASVTLADISPDALAVAGENAGRLLATPWETVRTDLFSALPGTWDIIVSNPPYLTDRWIEEADDEVKREPRLALSGGGADGMDLIRRLVAGAPRHLSPGGTLALECDPRQAEEVLSLLRQSGFSGTSVARDLAGRMRVVLGVLSRHIPD